MDLPKSVGVMILPNVNLFPHAILPLFIFEPRYRRMLEDSLQNHRMFCVAMQQPEADKESPSRVAGLGLVRASIENPDGTSNLFLQGVARVSLGRVLRHKPYRVHSVKPMLPEGTNTERIDALSLKIRELVGERFREGLPGALKFLGEAMGGAPKGRRASVEQILRSLGEITDASMLADLVTCTLLSDPRQRQVMLETIDIETRLQYLVCFLLRQGEAPGQGGGGQM